MCPIFAYTDYNIIGMDDGYFAGNSTLASITQGFLTSKYDSYTKAMVSSGEIPFVADLDGDGVNEIIVLDNYQFRLFHNKELTPIIVYNIPTSEEVSNIQIFDVDNDGLKEVIFSRLESMDIIFLNYNGTSFFNKTSLYIGNVPIGTAPIPKGDRILKCGEYGNCLMVFSKNNTVGSGAVQDLGIGVLSFNTTGFYNNLTLNAVGTNTKAYCFSQIPSIEYSDYDGDGNKDYIFSFATLTNPAVLVTSVYYIQNIQNTLTIKRIINISTGWGEALSVGTLPCRVMNTISDTLIGGYFSSPVVFPFQDIDHNNGLETVIGIAVDDNEYKMKSYKPTGSTESSAYLMQFPSLQDADGIILSNPIKINAFPSSKSGVLDPKTDVCMLGYNKISDELDLLCGSSLYSYDVGFVSFNNIEYFHTGTAFNVSQSFGDRNIMIHSIESKTDTINNNNMDEVLTPYGIFELSLDDGVIIGSCSLNSQCEMNLSWTNPKGDGAIIPVDAERVGYDDLILLRSTNLWYFDDGYSNTAPTFDYTVNPCINSVWQKNTTLTVTITPIDNDVTDMVSGRAILYYGQVFAIDTGWSANYSSDTVISLNLPVNQTITSGTLRLFATDTYDFSGHAVYTDLSVSVGDVGIVNGACITSSTTTPTTATTGNYTLDPNPSDNVITGTIDDIDSATGFGLGVTIWYMIIMLVVGASIFGYVHEKYGNSSLSLNFAFVFIAEIIMFLIGLYLDIFGVGSAIILIIAGVLTIIIWIKNIAMTDKGG